MYINECVYTDTSNFQEGHEPVLAAFPKEPVVIFEPARRTKDEKWTNLEVYKTVQNEFRAYGNKRLKTWRLEMIEKCDHFVKPNKELSCGCWQFLLFLLSYTFVICLRFIIKNLILRLGEKWTWYTCLQLSRLKQLNFLIWFTTENLAATDVLLELNTSHWTLPLDSKSHSVFVALQCSSFSCPSSIYCWLR